jgi:hypothetical protein
MIVSTIIIESVDSMSTEGPNTPIYNTLASSPDHSHVFIENMGVAGGRG